MSLVLQCKWCGCGCTLSMLAISLPSQHRYCGYSCTAVILALVVLLLLLYCTCHVVLVIMTSLQHHRCIIWSWDDWVCRQWSQASCSLHCAVVSQPSSHPHYGILITMLSLHHGHPVVWWLSCWACQCVVKACRQHVVALKGPLGPSMDCLLSLSSGVLVVTWLWHHDIAAMLSLSHVEQVIRLMTSADMRPHQ